MARPIWRRSFIQLIRFALSLARASAGKSIAAKIAMMAITTSSSINVKAQSRASELRQGRLGEMSRLAHGKSYRAMNRRQLQSIYDEIDRLEKTDVKLRRYTTFIPLFQWPTLAAFALLFLELLLGNTRYRRVP